MRFRSLVAIACCLCGVACGDLNVRSVRTGTVVPPALAGQWQGTWTSSQGMGTGALSIQVQEFRQQPVIAVTIDNPCFVPRDYDLVLTGSRITLSFDGSIVMAADLATDRVLTGNYDCGGDVGIWSADWQHDLPAPVDLTGLWSGSVGVPGVLEEAMQASFTQSVRGGVMVLDGQIAIPSALPLGVPVTGYVRFVDQDFEFALQTLNGFEPAVLMTGTGNRDQLAVPLGLLQVLSTTELPFSQAPFQLSKD